SFTTDLDRHQALSRLRRPGTLVVIPSLEDNSPNTVYECLEFGIPVLASRRGGTPELIADGDRERVLFEPTTEGVEAALRAALQNAEALRPARFAFDPLDSLHQWEDILGSASAPPRTRTRTHPLIDIVIPHGGSDSRLSSCLAGLRRQSYSNTNVITVDSREH